MNRIQFSFKLRRAANADAGNRPGLRIFGVIPLALAGLLAWKSNGFHAEKDRSRYPEIRLACADCKFERITHSKGSSTRQIVLLTADGRYVTEDGVWKRHFDGSALAESLAGGGTVRAWLHPEYP